MRTTLALALGAVGSLALARPALAQGIDRSTPPGRSTTSGSTSPSSPRAFLPPSVSLAGGGCGDNMLVNGDFELNGALGCDFNLGNDQFDLEMSACHAFGFGEIDVMKDALGCAYGPPPVSGVTKLGIASHGDVNSDAFAFDLTAPILPYVRYRLLFHAVAETTFTPDPGTLEIGVSNDPGSFGILIGGVIPSIGVWSPWAAEIGFSEQYRYLTVRAGPGTNCWIHTDAWALTPICDRSAGTGIYGTGWPGTLGVPAIWATDNPRLCTPISIGIGNSRGTLTQGVLMLGLSQIDVPTALGGRLMVGPSTVVPIQIPKDGASLPVCIPCDAALCGLDVFLQALENDPGASLGVSFTLGLWLGLGS